MFLRLWLIYFRNWTDPRIFPCLRKIVFPDTVVCNSCEGPAMESATILTHLMGIPSGPVDVSDLNNFSTRRISPWDTSRSLKLAGLSSGRDSISSSRQKGKSLLTGKVLLAVQTKNEILPQGLLVRFHYAVDNTPHLLWFTRG